jgi:hypothetical protein
VSLSVVALSVVSLCLGGTIARADQPAPAEVVVEVGLPPVPPTTIVVDVGVPPVPPTTVAVEVDPPPLPDTFGGDGGDGTRAGVSSIAGAIAATADAAWRTA